MIIEIKKCVCGKSAILREGGENYGQGGWGKKFWVESECGIRGKEFDTYFDSETESIRKAIEFWNEHSVRKS